MSDRFTVSFRFTKPGDKKPGPVQRYVIYASTLEEAEEVLKRQATYPNLEVLDIKKT